MLILSPRKSVPFPTSSWLWPRGFLLFHFCLISAHKTNGVTTEEQSDGVVFFCLSFARGRDHCLVALRGRGAGQCWTRKCAVCCTTWRFLRNRLAMDTYTPGAHCIPSQATAGVSRQAREGGGGRRGRGKAGVAGVGAAGRRWRAWWRSRGLRRG